MELAGSGYTQQLDTTMGFDEIKQTTQCPFAKRSVVEIGNTLPAETPFETRVADLYTQLGSYIHSLSDEGRSFSDGFVAAIPAEELGDDVETLGSKFRELYRGLKRHDGFTEEDILAEDICSEEWQLELKGQRMFMIVFSPVYPPEHSRHSPDPNNVYMFFQPESSFHEHIRRSRMDKDARTRLKETIRQRFANAGRPYDPHDTQPESEAQKYIKPRQLGEAAIHWWDDPQGEPGIIAA